MRASEILERIRRNLRPREYQKTASVLSFFGLSFIVFGLRGATRDQYYGFLLVIAFIIAIVYSFNRMFEVEVDRSGRERIRFRKEVPLVSAEAWRVRSLPMQLAGAVLFIVVPALLLLLVTGAAFSMNQGTAGEKFNEGSYQAFVVAPIEEFAFRWVLMQTLIAGVIAAPPIFAFSHPRVKEQWLSGQFTADSTSFFVTAVLIGYLLEAFVLARYKLPKPWNLFFGIIFAVAFHATWNVVAVVFSVQVYLPMVGTLTMQTLESDLALLLSFMLAAWLVQRGRQMVRRAVAASTESIMKPKGMTA